MRGRLPRHDRGGVQRADAAVVAAARGTQRSSGRARRVPRRAAAAVRPAPAAAGSGDATATALFAWAIGLEGTHDVAFVVCQRGRVRHRVRARAAGRHRGARTRSASSSCCCRPSLRSPGCSVRLRGGLPGSPRTSNASRRQPIDRRRGSRRSRSPGVSRERRAGRDHPRRGASSAAEYRGLRRYARARGDDAAPRHRRDSRGRDDWRPARAVPRAGILAVPGLQGQSRQYRRLRVHQGSRAARRQRRRPADHGSACGPRWSCPRPSGCRIS